MFKLFWFIKDWFAGKPLFGRSSQWSRVRKEHLKKEPVCVICGSDKVSVHHKIPFHLDESLELSENNLITLCDYRKNNCHYRFGHLFSYHSYNSNIEKDSVEWYGKIKERP